jgi:arsenate reductase
MHTRRQLLLKENKFMKRSKKIIVVTLFIVLGRFGLTAAQTAQQSNFFPALSLYCQSISSTFNAIPEERKIELKKISDFVVSKRSAHKPANILYVCTSNSRRSHMAQVWGQIASYYYNIDSIYTFSGGTEQTRVNVNATDALKRCGIEIYSNNQGDNPLRYVKVGPAVNSWALFSKKYTDTTNPTTDFAAILVCTEADKSCPIVDGADSRIGLPYQDPKEFDNSPMKADKYDERCKQIATEMFYIMHLAKVALK